MRHKWKVSVLHKHCVLPGFRAENTTRRTHTPPTLPFCCVGSRTHGSPLKDTLTEANKLDKETNEHICIINLKSVREETPNATEIPLLPPAETIQPFSELLSSLLFCLFPPHPLLFQ